MYRLRSLWAGLRDLFRGGLRTRILTWIFAPAVIVLAAVALVNFYAYKQVTEELVVERDRELVRLSAGQLGAEIKEFTDLLDIVRRTAGFRPDNPDQAAAVLHEHRHRLAIFDGGVVVLNTFGMVTVAEPMRPDLLGGDWSERDIFRRVAREPGQVFSNILTVGGAEMVAAAVPILAEDGAFLGLLVGMFHLDARAVSSFYGQIVKLRIGEGGETYLLDAAGRVIYHSNSGRIGADFSAHSTAQAALLGQVGTARFRETGGRDLLAAYAPVPGTSWVLVMELDWWTQAGESQAYQAFLMLLLALGVLVPLAVVAVGMGRITRPLEELIDAAREVAGGKFGRLLPATGQDEIGALTRQFNRMSTELQESYALLEQRVADRTRELEALYAADEELLRHLDLDRVLQALADVAVVRLHADKSCVMVWDDNRGRLTVRASHGFAAGTLAQMDLAPGEGMASQVASNGIPAMVEDAERGRHVATRITGPEGIRSFMHFPIRVGAQVFGVFNVSFLAPRAFGPEERRLFEALAQRAALAIENARLYGKAEQTAVAAERSRLARELHDAVTQTLFAASLIAEVLPRLWVRDPEEGLGRLEELRELSRGALAEMRMLLLELRPAALEDAALADLLKQLCEAANSRARISVSLETDGTCSPSLEGKVALYRIAQEALNNVIKHARATEVRVSLRCGPDGLHLCIRDDGRGFAQGPVSPDHLGLGIMRERAEALGADLEIESRPGRGTRVEVYWEIENVRLEGEKTHV